MSIHLYTHLTSFPADLPPARVLQSRHLLRHVGMQMVDVAQSSFGEVCWNKPTSGVEMVPCDAGAGLQISPKVGG